MLELKDIQKEYRDDFKRINETFADKYFNFQSDFFKNEKLNNKIMANIVISISCTILLTNLVNIFESSDKDISRFLEVYDDLISSFRIRLIENCNEITLNKKREIQ